MTDAERYQWLKQHLYIATNEEAEWTCWLAMNEIPFRLGPEITDPEMLLDALMKRFPREK